MARSDPRPSFGLPDLLVAIHTSRQSCSKAGKAQMFALVWESSGESRINAISDAAALHEQDAALAAEPGACQNADTFLFRCKYRRLHAIGGLS